MKRYKYIKSNAFTAGASLGNPAACVFTGEETLAPEQMQAVAREHKGFVEVFNAIDTENAVYITAPDPIEHPLNLTIDAIGKALGLNNGVIRQDQPVRIIDAGLRTLLVPIVDLETEISIFPNEQQLKAFCEGNDIDIILIFSKQTADAEAFAHTRVFAPKFGYLEDPATGSGNSAFAYYLLSENLWNGQPITIEQGGNDRIFNSVKLKHSNGQVLFGGKATVRIEGDYNL